MKNIGLGEILSIDSSTILKEFERFIGPSLKWDKKLNLSIQVYYSTVKIQYQLSVNNYVF